MRISKVTICIKLYYSITKEIFVVLNIQRLWKAYNNGQVENSNRK